MNEIQTFPSYYINKNAIFFKIKYLVEINLTLHGDESLTLFLGNFLNFPTESTIACKIKIFPRKLKYTFIPSCTTYYNWNQIVDIDKINDFEESFIIITFGEILNDSSKPQNHKTGKVICKLNKNNIYGKICIGLIKNAKFNDYFLFEKSQILVKNCIENKGKKVGAFLPLLDQNYLKTALEYYGNSIYLNTKRKSKSRKSVIISNNESEFKEKRTSVFNKINFKLKKSSNLKRNSYDKSQTNKLNVQNSLIIRNKNTNQHNSFNLNRRSTPINFNDSFSDFNVYSNNLNLTNNHNKSLSNQIYSHTVSNHKLFQKNDKSVFNSDGNFNKHDNLHSTQSNVLTDDSHKNSVFNSQVSCNNDPFYDTNSIDSKSKYQPSLVSDINVQNKTVPFISESQQFSETPHLSNLNTTSKSTNEFFSLSNQTTNNSNSNDTKLSSNNNKVF